MAYDGFGLADDLAGGFTRPGSTRGFHLHVAYRDKDGLLQNPLDVMPDSRFSYNDQDPTECEEQD